MEERKRSVESLRLEKTQLLNLVEITSKSVNYLNNDLGGKLETSRKLSKNFENELFQKRMINFKFNKLEEKRSAVSFDNYKVSKKIKTDMNHMTDAIKHKKALFILKQNQMINQMKAKEYFSQAIHAEEEVGC